MINNSFNNIENAVVKPKRYIAVEKKVLFSDVASEYNSPRWIISLADLLSLLLIFFVLMFGMSTTSKVKYQQSVDSLQKALMSKKKLEALGRTDTQKMVEIKEAIDKDLSLSIKEQNVSTVMENDGVRIIIKDSLLYESGDAVLKEGAEGILNTIATSFKPYKFRISVEGHTDNEPIETDKYPSNWELSSARASSVVKYLINRGISSARLVAVGFADNKPLVNNNSLMNKAKNRRVEIKILQE